MPLFVDGDAGVEQEINQREISRTRVRKWVASETWRGEDASEHEPGQC